MAYQISRSKNPQHFAATARRLANFGMALPSHLIEEGRNWYPSVREATFKGSSDIGISGHAGAGIVAAVSPNMDFEGSNINALHEITKLDRNDWSMIQRSSQEERRIPEVAAMITEKAPSLSRSYDSNLVKAHRILSGENFEDVLLRRSAPKTNSFARNIYDPNSMDVTVDGRHHDLIANRRLKWEDSSRGISSANLTRGRSRYEEMEDVTRVATNRVSSQDSRFAGITPKDLQAILWLGGKQVERRWNPERKTGDARKGQPYMSGTGRPLGL